MRALLMHRDRDLDLETAPRCNAEALVQDLELDTLFSAMASGDAFLFDVARTVLLSATGNDLDTIRYRQEILKDCFDNPEVVRACYAVAVEGIERRKKHFLGFLARYPASILSGSVDVLRDFADVLEKLRKIADKHAKQFTSEGFTSLFATLRREFSDEYLQTIREHLRQLKFRSGILVSAELGTQNEGANYVLRMDRDARPRWLRRLWAGRHRSYTFRLHPRDEAGARILSEMAGRGINRVANALAQSADHTLGFLEMLRAELAFYVGCLNLRDTLDRLSAPICLPEAAPIGTRLCRFTDMTDVCLTLAMGRRITGNTVDADGKNLVVITGANQGGKSTFLRSLGLAQLMMQAGMFVTAAAFSAEVCSGVYTHYKREEDESMKSGKLDEELARMSDIVDLLSTNAMILFNESFASTNEVEGSEIARQIVTALLDRHVKVAFVTHQYRFAQGFVSANRSDVLFLRAEREADGTRRFQLVEGKPLETSFGEDLYLEVFGRGATSFDAAQR